MTKIKLYPNDTNISGDDKWIGSDGDNSEVTKNFTVDDVGAYINALGVESVSTSDGSFIDLTPNTPTIGDVIVTADLSATGTPGATTFLRGDNSWSTPVDNNTTYDLGSSQQSLNVNINLTPSLGDVDTVSLIAGTNMQLVDDGSNNITINSTATAGIDGSGTANYLPVWQDSDTLTDSFLQAQSNTLSTGVLAMEWDTTIDGANIQFQTSSVSRLKIEDTTVTIENSNLNVTGGDIYNAGFVQAGSSSETPDVVNVGAIRYRSDANNSYQEMSMQTGATTYAWVIIQQNTW